MTIKKAYIRKNLKELLMVLLKRIVVTFALYGKNNLFQSIS